MNEYWVRKSVSELFDVKSGDYHAKGELDPGRIPLISCGDTNNGLVGFFNIPRKNTYRRAITVAYNGQPLTAKFHPYRFGAKDDVAVLIPRSEFPDTVLLYVAAILNRMKWRYSYGRKCFRQKLSNVAIPVPVSQSSGSQTIDYEAFGKIFRRHYSEFIPERQKKGPIDVPVTQWRRFGLLEIFDLKRGDFHSLKALGPGRITTVSRVTDDNGVVGYFEAPQEAEIYPRGLVTINTVGGDAFVQLDEFIATDNVVVCKPRIPLLITTLFFIAFVLNHQKWRYSYGRQCYIQKLRQAWLYLPVNRQEKLDEKLIERIVTQTSYWPQIDRRFQAKTLQKGRPMAISEKHQRQ